MSCAVVTSIPQNNRIDEYTIICLYAVTNKKIFINLSEILDTRGNFKFKYIKFKYLNYQYPYV